jgi:hypothetical protein
MQGLTSPLWPIRYKPLPDELLSSWLVRLARGHGLRVQTFCNLIFGNQLQVWNRDIDRLGPDWLVDVLSERTGTPIGMARRTTLRSYEGRLYPAFRTSGALQWITTLQMFHRTRQGFGMQYCPQCLFEDRVPYFRKAWRVAFVTTCPTHQCMLRDRCVACGAGVAFHRGDMGNMQGQHRESIADCFACGASLASDLVDSVESYEPIVMNWLSEISKTVLSGSPSSNTLDTLNVMRQMALLLQSRYPSVKLHGHVCSELAVPSIELVPGHISFESRVLAERHHVIQLVGWMVMDLEPRLRGAWRTKAVRYNHMLKDFDRAPQSYLEIVEGFANWRNK